MSSNIHITRNESSIPEKGVQQRADNPSTPVEGQEWYNAVEEKRKVYIGGSTKNYAFEGEAAGQTLYSTVVSNVTELASAASTTTVHTIFLRAGTYDLTGIGTPGIKFERPVRLIGEKATGDTSSKVTIKTDSTHYLNFEPLSSTVVSNNTISVTNGSKTITLVGGTWATNIAGYYIFINGTPYKINTNPTTTSALLLNAYSGPSVTGSTYIAVNMIDGTTIENINFESQTSTHDSVILRNVYRPTISGCRFYSTSDSSIYGRLLLRYNYNALINNCAFENFKIDLTNHNYDCIISENDFKSSTAIGTASDAIIDLDTALGTSPIASNTHIINNNVDGPATFALVTSSNGNVITGNTIREANKKSINVGSNSNHNIISSNILFARTGSETAIEINGDYNIVSSNRINKASGFAISFTATASNNLSVGNLINGGATINDTIFSSNLNRIEDDLTRLGDTPTGTTKDFIDQFNEILVTLQNVPKELISQTVAVNSGVVAEDFVYWNTSSNEYQLADASISTTDAVVGPIKNISSNSGDVYLMGLVEFASSGNIKNSELFDATNIGKRMFLGISGHIYAEDEISTNLYAYPDNPVEVGMLIDVVGGGQQAQLLVSSKENVKFGTPSNSWNLGVTGSANKDLEFAGSSTDVAKIRYIPSTRRLYSVVNGMSGEITQPFNKKIMKSSVFNYTSGNLINYTSSNATIYPHTSLINGVEYVRNNSTTVSPITSYSGYAYIFDGPSGASIATTYVSDKVFVGAVYNSGSVFTLGLADEISTSSAYEASVTGNQTPATTSYTELARAFIVASGTIDFAINASLQAEVELQELTPFQNARIKLQLNGTDLTGTERVESFAYVSGQVIYHGMQTQKIAKAFSTSGQIHQIRLMGAYDNGGSTAPITFSNVNLSVKGL